MKKKMEKKNTELNSDLWWKKKKVKFCSWLDIGVLGQSDSVVRYGNQGVFSFLMFHKLQRWLLLGAFKGV